MIMTYVALKTHILSSLNIASDNLSSLSTTFTKLYQEFQTDAVNKVTIQEIPGTCFKWVKSATSNKNNVLLFFHGGGFTMGSTADHLELIAQLILKTNLTVLSIDYRLVPNFIFPAPVEDARAAYSWLLENGFASQNIGFAGISAGGLLVTQLILACQQFHLPLPKVAVVMSGPGNLAFDKASIEYNKDRDWIEKQRLLNIRKYYLPKEKTPFDFLLSPIDATYANYPTTLFQAGDYEVLLSDSICFFEKLRQRNFNVYLDIVSQLPHCWQLFASAYAPGQQAIENVANFLQKNLP